MNAKNTKNTPTIFEIGVEVSKDRETVIIKVNGVRHFFRVPPNTRYFAPSFGPGGDVHISDGFTAKDDLAAHIGIRFEEHRVHTNVRFNPAGLGLDDLGPTHLASVSGDVGIQRHVLGLERSHS